MLFIFSIFASIGNFNLNQKLLKEVYKKGDKNGIISPYSLMTAMQMVRLGSFGETREELDKILNDVSTFEAKDTISANSFWFKKGSKIKEQYKKDLNKLFNASVFYLEEKNNTAQAKRINKWVAKNTQKKITKLVTPDILNDVDLLLLNTIYFNGKWESPFNKKNTKSRPFYDNLENKSEVKFMFKTAMFEYFENEEFQLIEIPYMEDAFLYVVLPRKNIFANAINILSEEYFLNMVRKKSRTEVRLYLPKIDLTMDMEAKEIFQNLGIKQTFTQDANFSEMTTDPRLFISSILHKVVVTWDEKGTKAAGLTMFSGVFGSAASPEPPKTVTMDVNHPFLFYITTRKANEILFSGYVQKL